MRVRGSWVVLGGFVIALTTIAADDPLFVTVGRKCKPCGQEQAGYWNVPVDKGTGEIEVRQVPYYPQPGDILLYDYPSFHISLALRLAGSGNPMHAAIVVARPDGTPAVLEVGPNSKPHAFTKTYILDVYPRLASYPGQIEVRRPRHPLTPEQSAALTQFALEQEGKKFAVGRLLLQATPFRCRYGVRHYLFARTTLDRSRWICSENVVAAGAAAGVLDPKVYLANAMYPRDLAYDERFDLSPLYHPPYRWAPDGDRRPALANQPEITPNLVDGR